MNVDDLYMDRDSQVAAIEKTFEDALKPITTHYSKPHIHPVEVMPVLPDSNMWKYPCAQVTLLTLHPSPFTPHKADITTELRLHEGLVQACGLTICVAQLYAAVCCQQGAAQIRGPTPSP